jgi:hypothetical protein
VCDQGKQSSNIFSGATMLDNVVPWAFSKKTANKPVQKKLEDRYFSLMIKHIFKKPVFSSQTQRPECPQKQVIGTTPCFSHFRFFCRFNENVQSCWNLQKFIYKKITLIQMVTKTGRKKAVKSRSLECTIFKKNGPVAYSL